MKKLILGLAMVASAAAVSSASARDTISIVGSSTVYPFATVVAERFGKSTDFPTPKIESTGSGGGLKLFCTGLGVQTADITNASRRIKQSEIDLCAENGVADIVEVKIGYDGVAMANSKSAPQMSISRKDLFMALGKSVPGPDGKFIENPYKTWQDVNPDLPATKIEVLGPPPTSGTRDSFNELGLEGGARQIPDVAALYDMKGDLAAMEAMAAKLGIEKAFAAAKASKGDAVTGKDVVKIVGRAIREDGAYIEAGENDNLIVQKIIANPNAVSVFGFSYLDQNADALQGVAIDGTVPAFDAISNGEYNMSRAMFFYVKKAHIGTIPGMEEYMAEFASEDAIGQEGYLLDRGLIPQTGAELEATMSAIKELKTLPAQL